MYSLDMTLPVPPLMRLFGRLRRILVLFESELLTLSPVGAQAAAGAEKALQSYGNSLLRLAFSYMHNMQDAEDALQDTLIQYMRKAPAFESEEREKAWLITVTCNICKNKLRHTKHLREDELTDIIPDERQAEDLSVVWECVKSLPDKYSEVLHLYYYEGYSIKEIADMLGKNEATVRSLMSRGRNMLKAPLEDIYGYEE